jgi:WD40 repeat protein
LTTESEGVVFGSFSADGNYLVLGARNPESKEGAVYLVDILARKLVWKRSTAHSNTPLPIFAPNARHIYVTLAGATMGSVGMASLRCWDIEGPREIWSRSPTTTSIPRVTPDGSQVITGGPNHSLEIWDANNGDLLQELPGDLPDVVNWSGFSPDGRDFVSLGRSGYVLVRDWQSKLPLDSFAIPSSDSLNVPHFTPDGDQLVVRSPTAGAVDIRDVHPWPTEVTLVGHQQAVKGVNFSPDGTQVTSVSRDGTLRVWNASTGQELRTISAHPSAIDMAFAPRGNCVATGGRDGAKLWSVESGRLMHHLPETTDVWWIDFSPDGRRVVSGGGPVQGKSVLWLFDVSSGRQLLSRESPGKINGLVFCADGRRVISVRRRTGQLDL